MKFILTACLCAGLMTVPVAAEDAYPSGPVTIVVPYSPGGSMDSAARIIADGMKNRFGVPFVVENKPGSNGLLALDQLRHVPADGRMLVVVSNSLPAYPLLTKDLKFDPVAAVEPASILMASPLVLAAAEDFPPNSLKELIDYVVSHPGDLDFGTTGPGLPWLMGLSFAKQHGFKLENIPYKGANDVVNGLMSSEIQLALVSPVGLSQLEAEGKLKTIAVTGKARNPQLPGTATFLEQGFGAFEFDNFNWIGLMVPAGTPPAVVEKLSAETQALVTDPAMRARIEKLGFVPVGSTSAEFSKVVAEFQTRWAKVVADLGFEPQ